MANSKNHKFKSQIAKAIYLENCYSNSKMCIGDSICYRNGFFFGEKDPLRLHMHS